MRGVYVVFVFVVVFVVDVASFSFSFFSDRLDKIFRENESGE